MSDRIHVLGAGLVGALLSLRLAQRGFRVQVYEKRPDPETNSYGTGRSINLALSHRGIHGLKSAGVLEKVESLLIPMHGRMIHDEHGHLSSQPYGKEGQFINSVSRSDLNFQLIKEAKAAGVTFFFDHECTHVDSHHKVIHFKYQDEILTHSYEVLVGADGAFSALRKQLELDGSVAAVIEEMKDGYKELVMPAQGSDYAMPPNHLHIWPRKNYMLIALPNPDATFTCTLFLSKTGDVSFASLQSERQIENFFKENFPDASARIPDFISQFQSNPTSSLVTVKTYPWAKDTILLIGDASHAIVPFYGQGMNAGFEDVRLFLDMIEEKPNWSELFDRFQKSRKQDADAISDLALENFVEMRDKVMNPRFQAQKKLEKQLNAQYPNDWIPLYSLVTFSDKPYSDCYHLGKTQQRLMDEIEDLENVSSSEMEKLILKLSKTKQDDQRAYR